MSASISSSMNTGVFARQGDDTIGARAFYLLLGIVLMWGFCATAAAAGWAIEIGFRPGWLSSIGLGLVLPILGIIIAVKSHNPLVSFIGYNLITVPYGIILGPVIQLYRPDVVSNALFATAGITAFMSLAGMTYPGLFRNLGGALMTALVGLILVRIAQMFIPAMQSWAWIEYLSAGIFTLYIGYDMYRASAIPKTVDNAVDIAVDLYLDILNLFLSLLRIMGKPGD